MYKESKVRGDKKKSLLLNPIKPSKVGVVKRARRSTQKSKHKANLHTHTHGKRNKGNGASGVPRVPLDFCELEKKKPLCVCVCV